MNKVKIIKLFKAGDIFPSPQNGLIESSVNVARKLHGDSNTLKFSYQGSVDVKVGISRQGYSFQWIAEKFFSSSTMADAEIPLDLSPFETGTIEITFFAVTDAVISYGSAPMLEKLPSELDTGKVLYDFLFPSLDLCCEEPLYMKFCDVFSYFSHEDKTIHLYENSAVDLLTYFNSFSTMKWVKYTNVRNLSVYLDIKGNAEVSVISRKGDEWRVIDRHAICAEERGIYVIPLALSESELDSILGITVRNLPYTADLLESLNDNGTPAKTSNDCNDADTNCIDGQSFRLNTVKREDSLRINSILRKTTNDADEINEQSAMPSTEIYGGGWLTDDEVTQNVNLGIVITTFKRETAVKAAVSRLVRDITSHPLYHDMIDIAVVDNGSTLKDEDLPGAQLIPNRNLGGTGGFTRGLIHFQESGNHTHCLFMDDDASCEAGAIFRSMSFQRHVTDHKVSLSGAMLFENIKFMQWENGAWFNGGCHSIKRDFDLRDPVKVYENEEEVDKPIYGAWWFFFFPLDVAKNYSLPFFVRGDDIDFSYANDFRVVSLNGVSCWQQDFKTKESAMTAYLFLRSHVVHHLTVPTLKCSYKIIMKILLGHFWQYNNSYYYGTAACVNLAMRHVMEGPEFWENNIVPTEVLKKIKELSSCEKPVPYTDDELKSLGLEQVEKKFMTKHFPYFIRRKSLYGHLMPQSMIRKTEKAMLPKWMTPYKEFTYMRSQITVVDELNRTITVLKRSPKAYFKNLFVFILLAIKLRFMLSSLRKKYLMAEPEQRSREFWKRQFTDKK